MSPNPVAIDKEASLTDLLNELLEAVDEHTAAMHALGVAAGAQSLRRHRQARGRVNDTLKVFFDSRVRLGERLRAEESRAYSARNQGSGTPGVP